MEAVALAGVVDSFGEAASRTLSKLAGLRLSESTVQRTVENVGAALGALQQRGEGLGPDVEWDWYQDSSGTRCAYVSVDATGVRQQGRRGAKAEGKMVHVGMIFNPPPADWKGKRPDMESRCTTALSKMADLERPLRIMARRVGVRKAQRLIALTDGGSGLDSLVARVFDDPEFASIQTTFILDFYHARNHLVEFAATLHPDDAAAAGTLVHDWCACLKHEGGEALIARLRSEEYPERAITALQSLMGYLENNRHRMDYPRYQKMGWYIGSGAIESACKALGARMKGPGMRWGPAGSETVSRLRAMFRSDTPYWEAFWNELVV
jgi:hypothetical protein